VIAMSCQTKPFCPTNSDGCWWPAAQEPAWRLPTACRGRRAVCTGGFARNADFAACAACASDVGHRNGNRICGSARPPTYLIPHFDSSATNLAMAVLVGPSVAWCQSRLYERSHGRSKQAEAQAALVAPVLALGLLGLSRSRFQIARKRRISLSWRSRTASVLILLVLLFSNPLRPCCAWQRCPGGCLRRR